MAKIVFSFAGTGDPGVGYARDNETYFDFNEDIIRIHIAGCQHRKVGGGTKQIIIFPDLNLIANKIASSFSKNSLDIDQLQQQLGGAIIQIEGPVPGCSSLLMQEVPKDDLSNIPLGHFDSSYIRVKNNESGINALYYVNAQAKTLTMIPLDELKLRTYDENILGITADNNDNLGTIEAKRLLKSDFKNITTITGHKRENIHRNPIQIDNICLTGFSRGAVTTFATAQALHAHSINIPVDIIANQPVPGELRAEIGLNLKFGDLRKCTNIKSATLLYATHNLDNGWLHNNFFQQMAPQLPETTHLTHGSLPHSQNSLKFAS